MENKINNTPLTFQLSIIEKCKNNKHMKVKFSFINLHKICFKRILLIKTRKYLIFSVKLHLEMKFQVLADKILNYKYSKFRAANVKLHFLIFNNIS